MNLLRSFDKVNFATIIGKLGYINYLFNKTGIAAIIVATIIRFIVAKAIVISVTKVLASELSSDL